MQVTAPKLTGPQKAMLEVVYDLTGGHTYSNEFSPRQAAKARWPESPAWKRRTRMYNGRNGAVGGTMPMNAAVMLWRLEAFGLVGSPIGETSRWYLTNKGRDLVDELRSK